MAVTSTGYKVKPLETVIAEINTNMKSEFGDGFDVTPESPDGQVIGITAQRAYEADLQAEQSYNAMSPSRSQNQALDYVSEYNGVTRILNRNCRAVIDMAGSVGTLVPKGAVCKTVSGLEFLTDKDATLPARISATCTTVGEITVNVSEIVITDPAYPNWASVDNPREGDKGIVRETDPEFRARRKLSIVNGGRDTGESIESTLRNLGSTYVSTVSNEEDITVGGMPPNSFQVIIDGGVDSEIAEVIYARKPIGIKSFGTTVVSVYDTQGNPHLIGFSRPTLVPIFVTVSVTKLANSPVDVVTEVKTAIYNKISSLSPSDEVEWGELFAPVTNLGGLRVTELTLGRTALTQLPESIQITQLEVAQAVLDNIDVVVI